MYKEHNDLTNPENISNLKNKPYLIKLVSGIILVIFTLLISTGFTYSQSYYYIINKGVTDEYNMFAPDANIIIANPANDLLSDVQTLPFSWNFYGSPVTQYKISDNGYITFDINSNISDPNNTTLTNASAPKSSIFAFWSNLELSKDPSYVINDVRNYTIGESPSRVHVIQWHATPSGQKGNTNYLFFALRIYEQGNFDVIYQQIKLDASVIIGGTVGCTNSNGSQAIMVNGSPNFIFTGGTYDPSKVPVYKFIYGIPPEEDASLLKITLPKLVSANKSYNITGEIINHAVKPISSLEIGYQEDNNPPKTGTISGLNILNNESYQFSHPVSWQPTNPGNYANVKVWISKINGKEDSNHSDDTTTVDVFVNKGESAQKKVLIEEFSTAPCGNCPEGDLILDNILTENLNVIGITHHSGNLTDSMTIPESISIASETAMGAPSASIDRILWPGQAKIAIARDSWSGRTAEALKNLSPVEITLNLNLNKTGDKLRVIMDAKFVDYAFPGDMRMNVIILEDSIIGSGTGYDQANSFNETEGSPFYGLGNPIPGYIHRHVVRAVPTGAWGDAGVIYSYVRPGDRFNKSYDYIIPNKINQKNMKVIAFVSYYNNDSKEVLNAQSMSFTLVDVNEPLETENHDHQVYPNPFAGQAVISYNLTKSDLVRITIYDLHGNEISELIHSEQEAGQHQILFNSANLPDGIYFYRIITKYENHSGKLIIER